MLLNPPSPSGAMANREGTASFGVLSTGFAYPPHTLAVLAAACRQAGLDMPVLDAAGEGLDLAATLARIEQTQPALVGVYTSWATLDADRENLAALRRAFPRLPLIALGAGVRASSDELLIAGASHVLLGDPELAFAILAASPLPPPGIVRARSLAPAAYNHGSLLRDPALLPRPAWDAVPWQNYGFLTVFGARGCDDRCRFCAYITVQGRSYRPRRPQDVVEEMRWLESAFAPPRILVRDPVFARDRQRAMSIARGLAQAGFRTPWECESRPEHFDAALLRWMARAGCTTLKLGIETAHPGLLVALGRIAAVEEAAQYLAYTRQVVALARRYGISTRAYVMAGLPGQTLAHSQATAAYLRQLQPTYIHARAYVAYPGVPLGAALPDSQTEAQLQPLLAVAAERQAIAARPPSLARRLRRRFYRLLARFQQ